MKKWIPLWIKCPLSVFLTQIGRLPLRIVWQNMRWSFVQCRECADERKKQVHLQLQHTVYRYLMKKYRTCMDDVCVGAACGVPTPNALIWVFWWQGEQNAPDIIKTCIMNIRKNSGVHPVCVIDSENYQDFVQIPAHILKKVQCNKISITHLSDYLRMKLLAEHGGLWIDATVFVKKPIVEKIFSVPLWTVRNPDSNNRNISKWEWSINFMGGWKGNHLFCAMASVLERYWQEHDMVATYFMTDCLVRVIYDRYEEIRRMMTEVTPSNGHYYFFLDYFNSPLDIQNYEAELTSDTWLYKVSWKTGYEVQLPNGQETVYGRWKKDFGGAVCGEKVV